MPFVVFTTNIVPSRNDGVFVVRAILELNLFGANIQQEAHPFTGLPIIAIKDDMAARSLSAEALYSGVLQGAVDTDNTAALVSGQRCVCVCITVWFIAPFCILPLF